MLSDKVAGEVVSHDDCTTTVQLQATSLPSTDNSKDANKNTSLENGSNSTSIWPSRFYLLFLFSSWFFIDCVYNVGNKSTLKLIKNVSWTLTEAHFAFGSLYFCVLWCSGIKNPPKITRSDLLMLAPLGFLTATVHLSAVFAVYLGNVSFMHIVKAGEPLSSAFFTAIILGERYPFQVYAALIPVVSGIGLASFHEPGFSSGALIGALVSCVAASLRGIYSKRVFNATQQAKSKNLTGSNLYGVLTVMAFFIMLVPTITLESHTWCDSWNTAMLKGHSSTMIIFWGLLSCATYTWFNEISFLTLTRISPVTYAVANTSKRSVLIITSVAWFRNHMSPYSWTGTAVCLLGVLLYSLAKIHYKRNETPITKKVTKK